MPGKPFQSSLIPYLDEITELRRKKPPVSYARIAEILRQKHGLVIQRGAIGKFVKVRSKGRKVYFFKEEKRNREEQKDSIQIETDRAFEYPNPLPVEVREDDILKRIQNIITKNGRFDYLSLRDVPVSKCFLTNWTNLDVIKTRKAVIIAPIPQLF